MLVPAVLLSVVVLLLAAKVAQLWWVHRHILAAAAKLPCPPALPLLGNALFFVGGITNLTKNIIHFTKKCKQLFCIWIGPVPVFVVSDPSDVQIVLNNSNTLEKDDVYIFLKHFLGNGLLTGPAHTWKKYRRIISPTMHPGKAENFLPVFNDVSKQFLTYLKANEKSVDPRRELLNTAMDAVMRAVVGRDPLENQVKENLLYLFNSAGKMFTYRIFKIWLHIDWIFYFLYRREMKEALKRADEGFAVFNRELEGEKNRRNAIPEDSRDYDSKRAVGESLMSLCIAYPDNPKEDHLWQDEVITMVVGATDTIVAALAFLLVTLANDPYAQDKVYEEIQEVLGDSNRDITIRDVNALTYLGQAIMESMRIHGTFPVILRRATKDTKLRNSVLPAGSRILVPLHAMGWDAEQFPQPEKFIPERFSQEYQVKRHNYAFLPFSGGPRNCIGKTYAMHIMKVVVVHILRKYKVTTQVRLEDIEYELKVVMFSKTPLNLTLQLRTEVAR